MKAQRLTILLDKERILLGETKLPLRPNWVRIYALLGLYRLEETDQGWVMPEDIRQIPSRSKLALTSIGIMIWRHVQEMKDKGYELIESPDFQGTKRFRLNPSLQVEFDRPIPQVRDWLGLGQTVHSRRRIAGWEEAMLFIAGAEVSLEHGDLHKAEEYLRQLSEAPELTKVLSVEERLRALATRAWVNEQLGFIGVAEQLAGQAVDELRGNRVSAKTRAWIWIQVGRLQLIRGRNSEAWYTFQRGAERLPIEETHEWGWIEQCLSQLAASEGRFDQAQERGFRALEHFLKARWWYGVQSAYGVIGLGFCERAERVKLNHAKREEWLTEGLRWLERSGEIRQVAGVGGVVAELHLARICRAQGRFDRAQTWLGQAEDICTQTGRQRDLALCWLERSELEAGQKHTAKASEWASKAKKLMDQLEEASQLGTNMIKYPFLGYARQEEAVQ
jgi:tetratricopeptide (TPR) repeat protein